MNLKFVDIKTGGMCNNRCIHCVVSERYKIGNRSAQSYKKSVCAAVRNGATHISVTGGEPTIHEDIVDILSHAKAKGLAVTLQTNGRRLADRHFAQALQGLIDQYVIALHGSGPAVHDAITRRRGSFLQTVAGVRNISQSGASIIAKVVLGSFNANDLMKLAKLILKLRMDAAIFTFPHGVGDAKKNYKRLIVPYSTLWPLLHPAIDFLEERDLSAGIETFPFCVVHGYEHKVLECFLPQGESEVQFLNQPRKNWTALRLKQKNKFEQCSICCFSPICEGVWTEYAEMFGSDEFIPRRDVKYYKEFIQDFATLFGDE
jgi:sulfatase maturation enzyme AslB (radical SAM superfamily)